MGVTSRYQRAADLDEGAEPRVRLVTLGRRRLSSRGSVLGSLREDGRRPPRSSRWLGSYEYGVECGVARLGPVYQVENP